MIKHILILTSIVTISMIGACKKQSTADFRNKLAGSYACAYHYYYQSVLPGAVEYDSIMSLDTIAIAISSQDSTLTVYGQSLRFFSDANNLLGFGSPPPGIPALYFFGTDSMTYDNYFLQYAGGSYTGTYYVGRKIH